VRQLCDRALLLHEGVLLADGPPDEVLAAYGEILHQPVGAT
jgi:ABC-type polysaccharide/polyol phosphate transport system ATPase subunit